MLLQYLTSNLDNFSTIKRNLPILKSIIEQRKNEIHHSFRCMVLEVAETHSMNIFIKVDFGVGMRMNMYTVFRNMLKELGVGEYHSINQLKIDYFHQNTINLNKVVFHGDDLEELADKCRFFIRRIYDSYDFEKEADVNLEKEYEELIAFELQLIKNNYIWLFQGHPCHYIFSSTTIYAEEAAREILKQLYNSGRLVGTEVFNILLDGKTRHLDGLNVALDLWHGNSITFHFMEDFIQHTEDHQMYIINKIKELLLEFGNTVLFIFFFDEKHQHIQEKLMGSKYPFSFVEFNNRSLDFNKASKFIENEAFKYGVDIEEMKVKLLNHKDEALYAKQYLRKGMQASARDRKFLYKDIAL